MPPGDLGPVLLARPVVGFDEQVDHVHHVERELLLVGHHARTELDHARDRVAIERPHALFLRLSCDEPRVQVDMSRHALDVRREVGLRLEQLLEVVVGVLQDLIEAIGADHRDLDADGDRLRRECGRRQHRQLFAEILDPRLARTQRALHRLPDERLGESVERIDDEKAAVRAMQRAGLDHRVVRDDRT